MSFRRDKLLKAIRHLHKVALKPNGGPGLIPYTDFCADMGLGPPHNNTLLRLFLRAIVHECQREGWPDFAALVVHITFTGSNRGPGIGWYTVDAHGFRPGDIPEWEAKRDDCWKRAPQVVIG